MDSAARGAWPRASYLSSDPASGSAPLLSFRARVCHPVTRTYVRLLGPCFKTGRLGTFRQHPEPRFLLGGAQTRRRTGQAKLTSHGGQPSFFTPPGKRRGFRGCCASVKCPARLSRWAVTTSTPGASPGPVHLPTRPLSRPPIRC